MLRSLLSLLSCLAFLSSSSLVLSQPLARAPVHLALPLSTNQLSPFLVSPPPPSTHSFNTSSTTASPHTFTPLQAGYPEAVATLSGCSNVDFSAEIYVAGQGPYKLIVDTGSTTMAVVSNSCNCNVTPTFDTTGMTATITDDKLYGLYADGSSWKGDGWQGAVSVGDPSLGGSLPVDITFATIDVSNNFVGDNSCGVSQKARDWHQGIIGFAYPSIALSGTDSWFNKYVAATGIANEFTIQMCVTASGQSAGNLWLGAYDTDYVGGQFTYIPIAAEQHYAVYLNTITVNSQSTSGSTTALPYDSKTYGPCNDLTSNTYCAVVDSGTTFLSLPDTALKTLIATIQADPAFQSVFGASSSFLSGSGCYSVGSFASRATLNAELPTLSFSFGATSSTAAKDNTVITINAINGYIVVSYDDNGNAYYCSGLGSTGTDAAILGYSFMAQFTIRHDIANSQIGFAPTAMCGTAAPMLPNYRWTSGEWSDCSLACGGGVRWRAVVCDDVWNGTHPDVLCSNGFAGSKPAVSQACNTQTCAVDGSTEVTGVTISASTITPGGTYTVSYTYSGAPTSVALYLMPTNSTTTLPLYITRNASVTAGVTPSTFHYTVPPTTPPGQYNIGGYVTYHTVGYLSTTPITVTACAYSDPTLCGADVCWAGPAACSGHGQCGVSDDGSGSVNCTCLARYSNATCDAPPTDRGCSIQCLNEGYASSDSDCTCVCPSNFGGVICEQRYATLTAVFSMPTTWINQLAPGNNEAIFAQTFAIDVAYAIGLPPSAIAIQAIIPSGSTGTKCAVTFKLTTPTSTADLQSYLATLASLLLPVSQQGSGYSVLSGGLATGLMVGLGVVNLPPADVQPSTDTGESIATIVVGKLNMVIGVACGVAVGLMAICLICILVQRRETRKTLSHSAHRRKKSVLLREKLQLEHAV